MRSYFCRSRWVGLAVLALAFGIAPPLASAQSTGKTLVVGNPGSEAILPPELPWSGASRSLALAPDAAWATPFEQSGLIETPRYPVTVAWLEKLAGSAPEMEMVSMGTSPEGRELWMVVASSEGAFTPEAARKSSRPTLLVQAGIHGGEIDGKDAGMMLLRDLTVRGTKKALLANANILFIPILNVDGHERFSKFGRINQRGPKEMGWRTTSRNLNLNRDYAKLDTPELQALVSVLRDWSPDLYIDVHVTDGADCQYDVTWGYNGPHAWSPNSAAWLDAYFTPAVTRDLEALGHVPGPLVLVLDSQDWTRGNTSFTAGPRYSNGYGDACHIPAILVENHALKPYHQRVLGTYVFLESALRVLGRHGKELRRAVASDKKVRRKQVSLGWKLQTKDPPSMEFLGVVSRLRPSPVSGGLMVEWTGTPVTHSIPSLAMTQPVATVSRPKAYWIPPAWADVVERLERHGIEVERVAEPREIDVTMYRLMNAKIDPSPYEGHVRATADPVPERRLERFPSGSARVSTDQPLGDLAMLLLEPESPDSFFQWGFFLEVLQQVEYAENYIMEPLAARMLAENPELAREFLGKLKGDPDFAADPRARLQWFHERTPFFDARWRLYPVARED